MTTFKPGDRVTCLGHFGEWEVWGDDRAASFTVFGVPCTVVVQRPSSGQKQMCLVPIDTLTLVAPPLPPEPPVGSVVFCPNDGDPRDGEWFACMRFDHGGWLDSWGNPGRWADIAADARPAVPQPTVDEVLDALHAAQHDKHATNLSLGVALHAALWPEVPGE